MVAIYRLLFLSCFVICLPNPSTAEPALPANADALVEQGIAAYDAEDYQRAKDILLPLAEAGHPEAMHRIGRMHEGLGGVFPKDPQVECDWYEKAANEGLAKSMHNMNFCYKGQGRNKDKEKQRQWLLQAAAQDYYPSMINLARLDKTKGPEFRKWLIHAQDHGSRWARVDLWVNGYKTDSRMTLSDFLCVTWNIFIQDRDREYCD